MASVEKIDQLRKADIDAYWQVVRTTYHSIFKKDPSQVDDLRREVENWPEEEQILFFHSEPIDIATDLAGRIKPSEDLIDIYIKQIRTF